MSNTLHPLASLLVRQVILAIATFLTSVLGNCNTYHLDCIYKWIVTNYHRPTTLHTSRYMLRQCYLFVRRSRDLCPKWPKLSNCFWRIEFNVARRKKITDKDYDNSPRYVSECRLGSKQVTVYRLYESTVDSTVWQGIEWQSAARTRGRWQWW